MVATSWASDPDAADHFIVLDRDSPGSEPSYDPAADPAIRAAFDRLYAADHSGLRVPHSPYLSALPEALQHDVDRLQAARRKRIQALGLQGCKQVVTSQCNVWWTARSCQDTDLECDQVMLWTSAGNRSGCKVGDEPRYNTTWFGIGPSVKLSFEAWGLEPPTLDKTAQLENVTAVACANW